MKSHKNLLAVWKMETGTGPLLVPGRLIEREKQQASCQSLLTGISTYNLESQPIRVMLT